MIDQGKLRAYLDQALPENEMNGVAHTIANNPAAQQTLEQLRQERDETAVYLASLNPSATAQPSASRALNQVQNKLAAQTTASIYNQIYYIIERITIMFKNSSLKKYQPAITALAVITVIALLFSFAPVRSMAGKFLSIFRVQEVKIIPVDMNSIENLENNPELEGLLKEFSPSAEIVSGGGDPQEVASLTEAANLADFRLAKINALPDDLANEATSVAVMEESVYKIQLNKELLEAIFDAAKIEISLPDSLNNQPIMAKKPTTIMQAWGVDANLSPKDGPHFGDDHHRGNRHRKLERWEGPSGPTLMFVQLKSPEIEYPDDLDLNALGVAALQLIGMSKAEATAIGSTIDWANTLVLPIPTDANMTVTEVSINGATASLFTETRGKNASIMWQKDGITYLLGGTYSSDQMIKIAESVK